MKIPWLILTVRTCGLLFGLLVLWTLSFLLLAPELWQSQVNYYEEINNKPAAQIVIASAVCGDRAVEELLVLIKSAIYFSNVPIKFILFADQFTLKTLRQITRHWPENSPTLSTLQHQFDLRALKFPAQLTAEWKNLYKPCASQRLFLPVIYSTKFENIELIKLLF